MNVPGTRNPPSLAAERVDQLLVPLPRAGLVKGALLTRLLFLLALILGFPITVSTQHLYRLVCRFRSLTPARCPNPRFTGIPGPYSCPPTDDCTLDPTAYYVITKGLYVGIFHDW